MNLISQTSAFQSGDLEKAYSKKTWDAAEYIYWGIISLLIGFFILEFFVLKTTWQVTFIFKVILILLGFLSYNIIKPQIKSPDWLIFGYLLLFSSYCFNIIHLHSGFVVTLYFTILTLVIGSSNYLVFWNSRFAFGLVVSILIMFIIFELQADFVNLETNLNLGGYAFFSLLVLTAFIPDARKRNYTLNLERDLKKDEAIGKLNKKVNEVQLKLVEIEQLLKIDREKDQILRHDIKNKITNILGLSKLIDESGTALEEEEQNYLQLLKEVSTDLLTDVDNIFGNDEENSDIHLRLAIQDTNLKTSFKKVKSLLKPRLEAGGVELDFSTENTDSSILADPYVFVNLIEKILNYLIDWSKTNHKVILLTKDLDSRVRIEILAPSAKIPASVLNQIFKPLDEFEIQSSFAPPQGLGLQIAKNLTEKMGGYFKYTTSMTEGVTFKLEFPKSSQPVS